MDLFIAGTSDDRVVMIEMDGKEISMDIFLESVRQGMAEVAQITAGIQRLRSTAGKKKFEVCNGQRWFCYKSLAL